MAKKGDDTASALRIRENQRRSRNRRKELIDELQGRIQKYEREGVAATQEMQRAARKVAEENARLRSLLAHHGILQDEVDAFLRSCDEPALPNDASLNTSVPSAQQPGAVPVNALVTAPNEAQFSDNGHGHPNIINIIGNTNHLHTLENWSAPSIAAPQFLKHPDSVLLPGVQDRSPSSQHTTINHHESQSSNATEEPHCPTTSECFCPPTNAPTIRPTSNGLEISCETAATIIVEMRGDGDVDSIRASLGCTSREECSVRNSTVLQIMDEG
ncbi:hypothetical protein HBI68_160320 [Parastagonospora nodorum]|nr:hypothetical protein HBI84_113730 [Parastagonospora nodorum]KAH6153681.1 hypothetical protein HBI68_160320 [Parastagonospora nodorum]KAH6418238.1 hypothetical protein HBI14_099910 [Parastagonospora nodorum]